MRYLNFPNPTRNTTNKFSTLNSVHHFALIYPLIEDSKEEIKFRFYQTSNFFLKSQIKLEYETSLE